MALLEIIVDVPDDLRTDEVATATDIAHMVVQHATVEQDFPVTMIGASWMKP